MSDQYLFFKEHQGLSLFGEESQAPLDASNQHKLKLLAVSNTYGFVVVGFKNVIKMLSISELDSNNETVSPMWTRELDAGHQIVHVLLNCLETSLFVMTYKVAAAAGGEHYLHVYDLEYQTPVLMNTINLRDEAQPNSIVLDLCPSPSEPDQVSVCHSSGVIQILSGVSDKKTRVVSKQAEAFCVCWSPKGKNLAVCSRSSRLLIFNTDLELKFNYECLTSGLTPKSMSWLAKKQFIVFYEDENESPIVHAHEIITDKNAAPKDTFHTITDVGDLFAQDSSPYHGSFYISQEPNWNLILLAYSKSPDLSVVRKQSQNELLGFELLDIEDFRCSLPLTKSDDEQFPLGFGVSLNTKTPIEFGTFGKQPASPLVLFLTNMGNLETYYMINLQSKDRSICVEAKQIKYKPAPPQPATQQQQQQLPKPNTQPNLQAQAQPFNLNSGAPSSSASMFNFGGNQFGSNAPQQASLSLGQQKPAGQPSFSFNVGQQPSASSQSAFGFKSQQPPAQNLPQPQFNLPQQSQQQAQQKILQTPPSQSAGLQFSTPNNQLKPQILIQQAAQSPMTPINKPPQAMTTQQQIKPIAQTQGQTQNNVAKVKEFNQEVEEFKANVAKLFSGKDLSKQLLNLSIIKETKKLEDTFNKLVNEMKTISDGCSSLRTTLLVDFHNFEKLRLIKFDIVEQEKKAKPNMSFIQKSNQVPLDIDPFTRKKLDNVKYLFAYLQRELPNIKSFIEMNRRRKQDSAQVISLDGIYDTLRRIELECQQSQKRIQNLYAQIKFLRLDRNILDDFDHGHHQQNQSKLGESQNVDKQPTDRAQLSDLTNSKIKSTAQTGHNVSFLSRQMNTLELNDEETERAIKVGMEKSNKFYAQLFDVLNKRKQIPETNANFERLSIWDEKYGGQDKNIVPLAAGGADSSILGMQNINEASFLNFKTTATPSTPNVILNTLNQQLNGNTSTPSVQKPLFQQQQSVLLNQLNQGGSQQPTPANFMQQMTPVQQQVSSAPASVPQIIKTTEIPKPAVQVSAPIASGPVQAVKPIVTPIQSTQPPPPSSTSAQSLQAPTSQLAFHLAKPPLVPPSSSGPLATPSPAVTVSPATPSPLASAISGATTASSTVNPSISQTQLPTSTSSTFSFNLPTSASASSSIFGAKPQQSTTQPSKSMFSFGQPTTTTSSSSESKPNEKPEEKVAAVTPSFSFNIGSSKPTTASASPFSFGKPAEQTKPAASVVTTEKPTTESSSTQASAEKEQPAATKPVVSLFGAAPTGDSSKTAPFSFGSPLPGSKPFSFGVPASTSTNSVTSLPSLSASQSSNDVKENKEADKDKEVKEKPQSESVKPAAAVESTTEKKSVESTPSTVTEKPAVSVTETIKPAPSQVEAKVDVKPPQEKTPEKPAATPSSTAPFSFGTPTPSTSGGLFFGKPATAATTATNPSDTAATTSSSGGTSLFSNFLKDNKPSTPAFGTQPAAQPVNPFSSIVGTSTPAKPANEVDADMDSSGNGAGAVGGAAPAGGLTFGALSFGTKPATSNEPPKNVFGAPNANPFTTIASQPKLPFGASSTGGLLKTPTFNAAAPNQASQPAQPTSLFGGASTTTASPSGGNLFSSFKSTTPGAAKPTGFGAPPAFGAAPAFGTAPAFGAQSGFGSAPAFGSAPTFGSTPSAGIFGSATPSTPAPTFGGSGGLFGQAATTNQPNAFASLASSANAAPAFGSGFGQAAQQQPTFGALAQQTPTQPLFSSFGGGSNTGGFANPTSPSFTAYRK